MLPVEFTVAGRPRSHQTSDRVALRAWQRAIVAAAVTAWASPPVADVDLSITVAYFHVGRTVTIDVDNLLKPVQDALNGLVYADDRQVTQAWVSKTPIDRRYQVRFAPLPLLVAFSVGEEFVNIRVAVAEDDGHLLG